MSEIEIRVCRTWEEYVQCEELQKLIWDMPDYRDVVPANLLITAAKNGGLVLGAFDGAKMVGFAFGLLGSEGQGQTRRLKHTSHMLGVLPGTRARGLGAALKWKQRAIVLEQGLDLMTWTYDPLQAVNAQLNLSHLGAIARRYLREAYGEMTDALNAGIPSDRFQVEWHLASERVAARVHRAAGEMALSGVPVYEVEWNARGLPRIGAERELNADALLVEIPADVNALKAQDRALAVEWRLRTRDTFERAFAAGYVACEARRIADQQGRARVLYQLRQNLR